MKSRDFQYINRIGRRFYHNSFSVLYIHNTHNNGDFRYGISVSRKVGNAVVRNYARRRVKEIIRTTVKLNNVDIILKPKDPLTQYSHEELKKIIHNLMYRIKKQNYYK